MKGYTIQHSIELLEKQAGSGSGASTAAQVSFDNTGTGLDATNVQTAISEIDSNVSTLSGRFGYSTTEKVVGTWIDDSTLYKKSFVITEDVTLTNNSWESVFTISDADISVRGEALRKTADNDFIGVSCDVLCDAGAIKYKANAATLLCKAGSVFTVVYTKTAPASNTRSKKAKKEE